MPLCPALLSGNAASMAGTTSSPLSCMPAVIEASACVGSACVKWVPEHRTDDGFAPLRANEYLDGGELTGMGWCADNLRRAPFADAVGGEE